MPVKGYKGRTASGKVPQGRTLTTRDKFLDRKAKQPEKERPVVVIETNARNDLAVVQLSTRDGKDRTRLKNYQQGQSYFKHYVEVMDDEGNPIKVDGKKFIENPWDYDLTSKQIEYVRRGVLSGKQQSQENNKKIAALKSGDGKKGKKKR